MDRPLQSNEVMCAIAIDVLFPCYLKQQFRADVSLILIELADLLAQDVPIRSRCSNTWRQTCGPATLVANLRFCDGLVIDRLCEVMM
jgi:hypothetical protein